MILICLTDHLRQGETSFFWTAKEILADLLNLAAQYQLDDLITLVSKHLAAGVDAQNVANRTKALKLHQNHEPCKIAFDSILKKVMDDSSQHLLRALVWNMWMDQQKEKLQQKKHQGFGSKCVALSQEQWTYEIGSCVALPPMNLHKDFQWTKFPSIAKSRSCDLDLLNEVFFYGFYQSNLRLNYHKVWNKDPY